MNPICRKRASFVHRVRPDSHKLLAFVVIIFVCLAPANAGAMQANEDGDVRAFFLKLFGKPPAPHNVAIIIDSTAAMGNLDPQCKSRHLDCVLPGIQTLLSKLPPCKARIKGCGAAKGGNVAHPADKISLFTFPNVTVETASDDYNCGNLNPTIERYSFPDPEASSYAPSGSPGTDATYEIVKYSSDYRTANFTSVLNPDSDLVKAVNGVKGCRGLKTPGGVRTYFAGAIYAAQASVAAEQAARPGSQNIIIFMSDGEANSMRNQLERSATNSGTYPSWVDECGQAITAAKAATAAGTRVYSIADGAESSGCRSDTTGPYKGYSPCQTMQAIASSQPYFFSDGEQIGSTPPCLSATHPATDLRRVFKEIAKSIKADRPATPKSVGPAS